jgi:seryl-tRNA(Sec) selenium transferase
MDHTAAKPAVVGSKHSSYESIYQIVLLALGMLVVLVVTTPTFRELHPAGSQEEALTKKAQAIQSEAEALDAQAKRLQEEITRQLEETRVAFDHLEIKTGTSQLCEAIVATWRYNCWIGGRTDLLVPLCEEWKILLSEKRAGAVVEVRDRIVPTDTLSARDEKAHHALLALTPSGPAANDTCLNSAKRAVC